MLPDLPLEVILWSLVGGLVRILLSYLRSPLFFWSGRNATITVLASLFVGVIAALLMKRGPEISFVAGLGGFDALNLAYRGLMRKGTGMMAPGLSFTEPGPRYPDWVLPRQRKVLDYLMKYGRIGNDEYQKMAKVSHRTASYDLEQLAGKGVLRRNGNGRGTYCTLT
ncbi:MAG: hypothetical protein HY519_00685 [Candidatus Aenigmarchaeota archaeon]|nr:hypothetical protein [Candidatus Aenigmarchaeota archaeon]